MSHSRTSGRTSYLLKEKAIFTTEAGGAAVPQLLAPGCFGGGGDEEGALLAGWEAGARLTALSVSPGWISSKKSST